MKEAAVARHEEKRTIPARLACAPGSCSDDALNAAHAVLRATLVGPRASRALHDTAPRSPNSGSNG
jgi:hypothetical protein